VIVIFASRFDKSASSLAERWKDYDASLLTCDDLSVAGWRHFLNAAGTNCAVVNGQVVDVVDIDAVLIRWPGVFAQELIQIAAHDRDYVANEMMAFLVSWLSSLTCPVINKPTPVNLTGPAWRLEQWTHAATQLGIPVKPARRHVARNGAEKELSAEPAAATVTVVGDRCFGDVESALLEQSRQLARVAGVTLLKVGFDGPKAGSLLAGVDLLPDLTDEATEAVLDLLINREATAA
jgi:hypothetical protein